MVVAQLERFMDTSTRDAVMASCTAAHPDQHVLIHVTLCVYAHGLSTYGFPKS